MGEIGRTALAKSVYPVESAGPRDGETRRYQLPVETWIQRASAVFTPPAGGWIVSVTVDPDRKCSDNDWSNNTLKP